MVVKKMYDYEVCYRKREDLGTESFQGFSTAQSFHYDLLKCSANFQLCVATSTMYPHTCSQIRISVTHYPHHYLQYPSSSFSISLILSTRLRHSHASILIFDIQDPIRSYLPLIYPIKSTDRHTIWCIQVREQLLDIVWTELPGKWTSLGLSYGGSSFGGPSCGL